MPAALDVDWEALRTLAVAVGLAETSRKTGVSLDAIQQRSHREGWLRDIPRSQPLPPSVLQPVSLVSKPAEALGNVMRELNEGTRLNHARVARKISDKLTQMDEDELLMAIPNVLGAGKHAALVGAWGSGNPGGASLRLDLLASTLDLRLDGPSPDQVDIPD